MAIELMNLKGNITLGGEISGQVELDNTITEEIKDVLNSCKHIQTIINDDPKERMNVDIWALDPGIYYFGGEGNGFYGDLTHGTNTEDTTQRIILANGSILVLGGAYTAELIEKQADYLMGNIKRSYIAIGTTNHSVDRFYSGTLTWSSVNGFSGIANLVEHSGNRVDVIDDKAKKTTYPNTKAVKDYVDAAIAGIELPEVDSPITEITLAKSENLNAQTLMAGVYNILSPDGLSMVKLGKLNTIIKGANNILFLGGAYTEASANDAGVSYFDKPYMFFYNATGSMNGTISMGVFRGTKNADGTWTYDMRSGGGAPLTVKDIVSSMSDEDHMIFSKATSPKSVIDYFNSKLVPIDIDVGSEHADNEYYNANTVDQVLIEVVGLMEEMMGYIETFAIGLDELNARVEALENK